MPEIAHLEDMMGYQVHHTHLLAMGGTRQALVGLETTPAKVTALLFLRDHAGCDQTTLARFLSVNRSAAMKLVNNLAARDLIERRQGRDQRSLGLWLKPAGQQFLNRVLDALQEWEEKLSGALAPDERAELLRLLAKVRTGIAVSMPGRNG